MSEPSEPNPDLEKILKRLLAHLREAAELEHTIACQYLFAAFSFKKYPEEFVAWSDEAKRPDVEAQIERNRRWEAKILFTARQEMEHLALVQNLFTMLDEGSWMWRPNYPVSRLVFPMDLPMPLLRFNSFSMEVFRYYEKPDSLPLPNPFEKGSVAATKGAKDTQDLQEDSQSMALIPLQRPTSYETKYKSIQELYNEIRSMFDTLFEHRFIQGKNADRIVNEHFGFNVEMEPLVQGKYMEYVDNVIEMILEQGEGVGEVPPPLGSHFMAFEEVFNELLHVEQHGAIGDFALPVVSNPVLNGDNKLPGQYTVLTHPYTRDVAALYNRAYRLQNRMLSGFFELYDIDQTTGVRPPQVNAYFQTVFYPMMTMVMRPLGEILCRMPAFEDTELIPGRVPAQTAGPTFEYDVPQGPDGREQQREACCRWDECQPHCDELRALADSAATLAATVPEGVEMLSGRTFQERFTYLAENFSKMAENFSLYWDGKKTAPIPSHDFQNLDNLN